MNCRQTQSRLELHVLGGLGPLEEAAVREHLAGCADCRDAEADCRLLVADIAAAGDGPPPRAAFVAALHRATAVEIRRQNRRLWMRRAALGAAAAAAAVALAVGAWRLAWREGTTPVGAAAEQWRLDGAAADAASPADGVVVRGGSMYFLSRHEGEQAAVAVELASGRRRWRGQGGCAGYLSADDSRVYCLAGAGRGRFDLLALDAATGRRLWRFAGQKETALSGPCPAVPLGQGRVAWSCGGAVHVLDAATGEPLWRHDAGPGGAPVAVAGAAGQLYLAAPARFCCLDVATGRTVWQLDTPAVGVGRRRPLLALADGRAYVLSAAAGAGELWSLDLATRRVGWSVPAGEARHLLATQVGPFVRGGDVRAYDGRTGRLLWRREASGCGAMTAQGGLLYAVDSHGAGRLLALHQADGEEAWAMDGLRSCDAFRRVGRSGYVKTSDGVIHAIALRTP